MWSATISLLISPLNFPGLRTLQMSSLGPLLLVMRWIHLNTSIACVSAALIRKLSVPVPSCPSRKSLNDLCRSRTGSLQSRGMLRTAWRFRIQWLTVSSCMLRRVARLCAGSGVARRTIELRICNSCDRFLLLRGLGCSAFLKLPKSN